MKYPEKINKYINVFKVNKKSYTFVVNPCPFVSTKVTEYLKYGVFALNHNATKCTSITFLDMNKFDKNPIEEIKRVKSLIIRKIKRNKI